MTIRSVTHKNLIRGTIATSGATVIYYMSSINWSEAISHDRLNSALSVYLFAIAIALVPYGILVSMLDRVKQSTIFQITLFSLVIALPIICFSYWRLNYINTGGWDYFLIPIWQIVLLMILNGIFECFVSRTEDRDHKIH